MTKFRTATTTGFACVIAAVMCGCLKMETMSYYYELDPPSSLGMEGKLTCNFGGIHSDEDKLESQKKEMANFYAKEYKDFASQAVVAMGLTEDVQTTLSNKTDTKCDGMLLGRFHDFARALIGSPLAEWDYEIRKADKRLSVTFMDVVGDAPNDPLRLFSISIKCPGKIVEHNAHTYDEKLRLMTWEYKIETIKPGSKLEIHFVIENN